MPIEMARRFVGATNHEFDPDLEGHIEAAKADLKSVGIAASIVDSIDSDAPDHYVLSTVMAYVRGMFRGDEVWLGIYDARKDNLRKKEAYQEPVA